MDPSWITPKQLTCTIGYWSGCRLRYSSLSTLLGEVLSYYFWSLQGWLHVPAHSLAGVVDILKTNLEPILLSLCDMLANSCSGCISNSLARFAHSSGKPPSRAGLVYARTLYWLIASRWEVYWQELSTLSTIQLSNSSPWNLSPCIYSVPTGHS